MSAWLLLGVTLALSPPPGGVLRGEGPAYVEMLAERARAANNQFAGSPCDDAGVSPVSIRPWRIMNQPGLIVWREKVRVSGCGHTAIENVNIGRVGGAQTWRMTTGIPGDSLADMDLQTATFPLAAAQAKAGLEGQCASVSLRDVYVAARPGGIDVLRPGARAPDVHTGRPVLGLPDTAKPILQKLDLGDAWMEVWPFSWCGHDRTLGIVFIPLKDHSATVHFFLPVWQWIKAHGAGARPAPVAQADHATL